MNAIKTNLQADAGPAIDAVRADLALLKRDMTLALEQLKVGAIDGARETAEKVAARAAVLSDAVSKRSGQLANSFSSQIEQQPIASVLIAFSTGFVLSRLLAR